MITPRYGAMRATIQSRKEERREGARTPILSGLARLGFYSLIVGWFGSTVASRAGLAELSAQTLMLGLSAGILSLSLAAMLSLLDPIGRSKAEQLILFLVALSALAPVAFGIFRGAGIDSQWLIAHLLLFLVAYLMPSLGYQTFRNALLIAMLFSLGSMLLGQVAFSIDARSTLQEGRLAGAFGHPNTTGAASALAVFAGLKSGRVDKPLVLCGALVAVLTLSLTAFVGLIIAFAATRNRNRRLRLSVLFAGLLAYFVPLVVTYSSKSELDADLFSGRAAAWDWSLSLIQHPFFGEGIGYFSLQAAQTYRPWVHGHNQLIMDLVEGGLVQAIASFGIVALLGSICAKRISMVPFGAWSILLIHTLTEVPLFLSYPGSRVGLVCIFFGLILCQGDESFVEPHPQRGRV